MKYVRIIHTALIRDPSGYDDRLTLPNPNWDAVEKALKTIDPNATIVTTSNFLAEENGEPVIIDGEQPLEMVNDMIIETSVSLEQITGVINREFDGNSYRALEAMPDEHCVFLRSGHLSGASTVHVRPMWRQVEGHIESATSTSAQLLQTTHSIDAVLKTLVAAESINKRLDSDSIRAFELSVFSIEDGQAVDATTYIA